MLELHLVEKFGNHVMFMLKVKQETSTLKEELILRFLRRHRISREKSLLYDIDSHPAEQGFYWSSN